MKAAKQLAKIGVRFYGPQTSELFKVSYTEPYGFDHVVIGTGASRAIAAARAMSNTRDLEVRPILDDIVQHVQGVLTSEGGMIECDEPDLNMYCVLGFCVEREE